MASPAIIFQEVPPMFGDLNKPVRDLFNKGYNFGFYKLDVKTRAHNGVEFNVVGEQKHSTNSTYGVLESKYRLKNGGVTITEKWTTNNLIHLEVTAEDQGVLGSKMSFLSSFAPTTGKKTASIRTAYKRPRVHMTADLDFEASGPVLLASSVFSHEGFRLGAGVTYDSSKSQISRNSVGVGWASGPYNCFAAMHDASRYEAGVFQRVNPDLETSIKASWSDVNNNSELGVAMRYALDPYTIVRAKIDNRAKLGLGYTQRLRPGIALTMSALLDTQNFNQGGHQFGAAFEFEA